MQSTSLRRCLSVGAIATGDAGWRTQRQTSVWVRWYPFPAYPRKSGWRRGCETVSSWRRHCHFPVGLQLCRQLVEQWKRRLLSVGASAGCHTTSIAHRGPGALASRESDVMRVACITSAKAM